MWLACDLLQTLFNKHKVFKQMACYFKINEQGIYVCTKMENLRKFQWKRLLIILHTNFRENYPGSMIKHPTHYTIVIFIMFSNINFWYQLF